MAKDDGATAQQAKGAGLAAGQALILLLVLTGIAAGAGVGFGMYVGGAPASAVVAAQKPPAASAARSAPDDGHKSASHDDNSAAALAPPVDLRLSELPPIITNLASPGGVVVRLQAAVVYDANAIPHPEPLIGELASDVLAFLRTVSMPSLEGADGLRRLGEDLSDRAAVRSHGSIREFIIQSMVVQ